MISRFLAILATLCGPGDTDWETGQPTAARTFRNFGLDAADLGYPVEHAGKLIMLFGDG
jgi:hypothetical protein